MTIPGFAGLPAGIYERISDDFEGAELGVTRQRQDNDALADRLGLVIVDHYRDNDRSASTLARKPRPEYDRLIDDVRSGRIKVVVAYSNSRLTRQPRQLEDWIRLHDETGVVITTVVSGQDDLSTADGRQVARFKAAADAAEAERTSERVKRQKEQRLASGKPPASRWRTFGFRRDWTVIPGEAAVVREVFERVASGESMNSVTDDLHRRGVKRVSGEPWTYQATLRMLRSPIYCGRLSYKGQPAGPAAGVEILVPPELFTAAEARREKRPGRVNVRKHLLSGIAVCGKCMAPMTVSGRARGRTAAYVCNRQAGGCGGVSVQREALDSLVTNAIRTGLFLQGIASSDPTPDRLAEQEALAEQVAALDARIEQTREGLTSGALEFEDGTAMLAELRRQRKALEGAQAAATAEGVEYLRPLTDFETTDLGRRVAEIRRNLAGLIVGPVIVNGSNRFDARRVTAVLSNGERIGGEVLAERSIQFSDAPA